MNINCPHCEQNIDADDSYAGMACDCPTCLQPFVLPDLVKPTPTPPSIPERVAPERPVEKKIESATERFMKFLNEDQDPAVVQKVHTRASEICTQGEEVIYIAVQKKPLLTLAPDAVLLTNKRVIVFRQRLLGMSFEDVPWRDVHDIHVKEGLMGATITVKRIGGQIVEVDSLPKAQARKLYQFGQEMEEQVHHARRERDLEDKRAAAGGITIGGAGMQLPAAAGDDPMQKLKQLKLMSDQGLISAQEYEAKKADILSRM